MIITVFVFQCINSIYRTNQCQITEKNRPFLPNTELITFRGGWPMAIGLPEEAALEQAFDYYDAVTKEDLTKVDGVKRASERVQRLMRAYARHQGTQASIATAALGLGPADLMNDLKTMGFFFEAIKSLTSYKDEYIN
ncbi:MAG: hypothetical protein J6V04_07245 [Bacteroidales bacterium]|nr:hypothetical protein [Bacteroidales bacterium]